MFPNHSAKHQANGSQPKEAIQVARRRKDITYDHPSYQGIGKLGFEWGSTSVATWEDRLSELADYRKTRHCNVLKATAKHLLVNWVATKGSNTGCTKKERHHL
jgi:hypothetical protein